MPNDEWCTPEWLIEAARLSMRGIDLDPASNDLAQETVKARLWYTAERSGLEEDWDAESVWLNPPYSDTQRWVNKFLEEGRKERFHQGMLLVNNNTETVWFQELLQSCNMACFFRRRVRFYLPGFPDKRSPRQGQVLFYFINSPRLYAGTSRFTRCFGHNGAQGGALIYGSGL